jgi:hypothetical protein
MPTVEIQIQVAYAFNNKLTVKSNGYNSCYFTEKSICLNVFQYYIFTSQKTVRILTYIGNVPYSDHGWDTAYPEYLFVFLRLVFQLRLSRTVPGSNWGAAEVRALPITTQPQR